MLFAHLKRILKLDRLRLRGMSGATDEFTLAAASRRRFVMTRWRFEKCRLPTKNSPDRCALLVNVVAKCT